MDIDLKGGYIGCFRMGYPAIPPFLRGWFRGLLVIWWEKTGGGAYQIRIKIKPLLKQGLNQTNC